MRGLVFILCLLGIQLTSFSQTRKPKPTVKHPMDSEAYLKMLDETLMDYYSCVANDKKVDSLIDALDSEYVLTARLRGIPERRILVNHALRNSMVPVVHGTALILAYLAGGIVVIEYVFRFPGLGGLLLEAVSARDLPLIQATALFLAAVYVVVNLLADLLVVRLTPRLRGVGA